MGRNAGWSPRMGTYRTGISSSAACYKYLLEKTDVRINCELWKFFDGWITTKSGKTISKDAFEVKVNYIRWTLPLKRNGVPIFIAWRTWGLKINEERYWRNPTRKRKTEKSEILQWKLRMPPSPDSVTCNQAFNPANSPFCTTWPKKSMVFLRRRALNGLEPSGKSPMKVAYPTNMSLSETCHSHGRNFPCVLISLRAMNRDCLAVRNPWGVKG